MSVLACYKEIVKGQKMSLFHQTSLFDFSRYHQGLVHRHLDCRTLEMIIQLIGLQFKWKYLLLSVYCLSDFTHFFRKYECIVVKNCVELPSPF